MSRKKRIAMIGQKRIPSKEGGVENVVEKISVRLVDRGYDVTCFNRRGHHISGKQYKVEKVSNYEGIKNKSVFTINKKGIAAMTSSHVAAIRAALGKYDIVHFHAEGPSAAIWIPKLFRKKCVVTIHGLDWQRSKWKGFARRYIKWGEKMAVKFADEIIVLSKNMQEYFKRTYGRETTYIPNGTNEHSVREPNLIAKRFGLGKDDYILYLSRLVPEKGLHYLIEAYQNTRTDKKLVIAGGYSDTVEYCARLKKLSAGNDNIIFTGFVEGLERKELFDNAYIYALPSDLEGMPLSLLEAMSFGNCCLVSDIPECTEVVENKAVVFKKGNVADLRSKLQWLCDDSAAVAKYKSEAAEFILGKYNWDDVVDKTVKVYEK